MRARKICWGTIGMTTAVFMFLAAGCSAQGGPKRFSEAKGSPYRVGDSPAALVIADFNNDGLPDIATANSRGRSVSILLNEGKGSFRKPSGSPVRVDFAPLLIAAGDVNSDGKVDLALTDHDSYEVLILHGDGEGGFAESETRPLSMQAEKPHNHGLALADFNRDGNLDIATSNNGEHSISVLTGNGEGNFELMPKAPFGVGRNPYPLTVADVNRDSCPDILVPNLNGQVSLLLSNGKGSFNPAVNIGVLPRPYFLATGDFNNDSFPDFVTSHDDITTLSILLGDGKGGFVQAKNSPLDAGQRVWKIVCRDMDADGNADLIAAGQIENEVLIIYGDGSGNFSLESTETYPAGNQPTGLAVADLNMDGNPDIITCNSRSNTVTILLQE